MRAYTILITSSKAYSLKRKAKELTLYLGGLYLDENLINEYNIIDTRTLAIGVITVINSDIGHFAKIGFQVDEALIYGIIEGIPILTPASRNYINQVKLIAPSHYSKTMLEQAGLIVDDVIYFAVEKEEADIENAQRIRHKFLTRGNYEKIILWIGANMYRKGIDLVCDIAEYFPRYLFVLHSGHGEIPVENVLRGQKNCILHNKVFKYRIGDLYYASDLLLSTSRAEGFSLPPIEFLHFMKPIVVPSHPVHIEMLKDYAYYYPTKPKRYLNFYNLMYMEIYEPEISLAPDIIEKALKQGVKDKEKTKKYLHETFSINNYYKFKIFIERKKLV